MSKNTGYTLFSLTVEPGEAGTVEAVANAFTAQELAQKLSVLAAMLEG